MDTIRAFFSKIRALFSIFNKGQGRSGEFFRYWKSKKIYRYCIHTLTQGSCSVVFKHFRVLLTACVINIYLGNSFYIDINKNIISYFNTLILLSVILLPIFCKKMKHPLFLIYFGKRLEDKLWLGVGLNRYDRWTVVSRGVNLSLLRRSLCKRRVIV